MLNSENNVSLAPLVLFFLSKKRLASSLKRRAKFAASTNAHTR